MGIISDQSTQGQADFLCHFSSQQKSAVAHQFFASARAGASTVRELIAAVRKDAHRRLADGLFVATQTQLISSLTTKAAQEFAAEVLQRESLPPTEKARRKAAQRERFQRKNAASLICGRCGIACSRRGGLRFEFDIEQFLCRGCVELLTSHRLEDYLRAETLISGVAR